MTVWAVWSALPATAAPPPDRVAAAQLVALVNSDRAAAGLQPLTVSNVAVEAAEAWSAHMADSGELAHNDAWFSAESKSRALAKTVGENVAYNADVADAHRRLMSSPGHRANILEPKFHAIGVGVVRGVTGSYWITETFIELKPVADASAAPPPAPVVAPAPAPAPPQPAPAAPPAPAPSASASPVPAPTIAAATPATPAESAASAAAPPPADHSGSNSAGIDRAGRPRTSGGGGGAAGEVAGGRLTAPTAGPDRTGAFRSLAVVALAFALYGLVGAVRRERWQDPAP